MINHHRQGIVIMNILIMSRFLEMHMYVTSALQRTDMKSVFLQMAMDLLHKKVGTDELTKALQVVLSNLKELSDLGFHD